MIRLRPSGADELLIKRVRDWYEPGPGVFFTGVTGTASFSPAMLFTGSTTGAWYDPSDLTTLYQDAAGTTPVTAVEQPVGLMLDKRDTTYSTYFDGSGDYLTLASNSLNYLHKGASDWTVECWFYAGGSSEQTLLSTTGSSSDVGIYIGVNNTSTQDVAIQIHKGSAGNFSYNGRTATNAWNANAWNHLAAVYVYATNSYKIYINGVSQALTESGTKTYNSSDASFPPAVGRYQAVTPGGYVTGYISNLRCVNGTAIYTANFTPPTGPLTAVAGTSLLTCGTTWSGNPTITNNGNTRADKLNPFTTGTGNHAYNSSGNSANFPVLSARYNLLTKSEDISAAGWTKTGTTAASTSSLLETATTGTHACTLFPTTVAATYIYSVKIKANGRTRFAVAGASNFGGNLGNGIFFDLSTGSYVSGATGTPSITALADGWYQVTYTWAALAGSGPLGVFLVDSGTNTSYTGDVTKGMFIKEADLRVANDALNQPAYQRVNTATDYDTVGFKPYLRFNGTNQWLQTNSIDFTYGDKMFVCAGVRKLSGLTSFISELSANSDTNSGVFGIGSAAATQYDYFASLRGTSQDYYTATSFTAPITNVLSVAYDILGAGIVDEIKFKVNAATPTLTANGANAGTGNFGNYPLYIGARAGSSLFFNGRLYQMVVAGKQATEAEISSTETYINQRTGAF